MDSRRLISYALGFMQDDEQGGGCFGLKVSKLKNLKVSERFQSGRLRRMVEG